MKYLPSSKLKQWRQDNLPSKCPIFKCRFNDAVVDHCHDTGLIRGVLHRQSNAWAGKIENSWKRFGQNNSKVSLPDALRALADYLENARTDVMHPVGLTQKCKRFKRFPNDINSCKNAAERTQYFRTAFIGQCT